MTKTQKILFGLGIVVSLLFSFSVYKSSPIEIVGGVYDTATKYFRGGLKAGTTDQFSVSSAGAVIERKTVSTATADTTLTAAQSGTTFLTATAGVDFTLPTPVAGVWYRFIISGNFATTSVLVQGPATGASDDVMFGTLEVVGAAVLCSAEDTITFVNTAELPGDWLQIESDGTNWYITGQAGTTGGMTCTDVD